MNDCDRFRDALLDLVDGTLAPADLAAAQPAHRRGRGAEARPESARSMRKPKSAGGAGRRPRESSAAWARMVRTRSSHAGQEASWARADAAAAGASVPST